MLLLIIIQSILYKINRNKKGIHYLLVILAYYYLFNCIYIVK